MLVTQFATYCQIASTSLPQFNTQRFSSPYHQHQVIMFMDLNISSSILPIFYLYKQKQRKQPLQRDRAKSCQLMHITAQNTFILSEKAYNRQMTHKVTQGHRKFRYELGRRVHDATLSFLWSIILDTEWPADPRRRSRPDLREGPNINSTLCLAIVQFSSPLWPTIKLGPRPPTSKVRPCVGLHVDTTACVCCAMRIQQRDVCAISRVPISCCVLTNAVKCDHQRRLTVHINHNSSNLVQ